MHYFYPHPPTASSYFGDTKQRDFYYDTLRAIEDGINKQISMNESLRNTKIAKDLVDILQHNGV